MIICDHKLTRIQRTRRYGHSRNERISQTVTQVACSDRPARHSHRTRNFDVMACRRDVGKRKHASGRSLSPSSSSSSADFRAPSRFRSVGRQTSIDGDIIAHIQVRSNAGP
jgi:hypothetical protein